MLVPLVLAALVLLVTGFSLALSALYVFFRDLPHVWAVAGFILWMTSPLFYPIAFVAPSVRPYYELNPVGETITALREVTIERGPLHHGPIAYAIVSGLVALVLGAGFFRATRREFMDLL